MVEKKDVLIFSCKNTKLQLATEQPLTGVF